ncbi:hypothetical protein SAMN05660226_02574 [Parapedobacter luteus]|uniref:Uncharacterized protein n=1 Tax=Parapedobacter luteus TaxID=623280 RepID=A0A1T5D2A2_9SPHI|nr:hypothetical protein [Parapedobacter luteus]SKB65888.1 hypothetical protein SAMN05660226_02574 [Parapedobacter luteus]
MGMALIACNERNSRSDDSQADSLAAQQTTVPDSLLLVPGQSAGLITLGDTDSSLLNRLGQPDFSNAGMGKAVLVWRGDTTQGYPLSVFTSRDMGNDESARIQQVRVTAPSFRTRQSIHVGSTHQEIASAYPLRLTETYDAMGDPYTIYDTDEGIAFEIAPNNRCIAIIIHKKDVSPPSFLPLRDYQ